MRRFTLQGLTVIGLAACFATACSNSDPNGNGSGPVAPTPAAPANIIIDIAEINGPYSFYPSPTTVSPGRIVVWRNSDTATHHVVFDDMSVDTGTVAPGTLSQPITVAPGNWGYHCAIHPSMVGRVTVTASAGTAAYSTIF